MITARCPMCKRASEPDFRPFCSRRCADLDLQKWLTGAYAIPAADTGEDDEASSLPGDEDAD
jgi:endogenous inhibitor of DNA gyrase (YacG/DUF329 family)